jgi:hypothetical protein
MGEQGAIEYRPTPEYLHVTVIGLRTREFVSRFFREIPERCARLGCSRLLIEMRLEGEPLNVSTIFDLVRHFIAEIKAQRDPISVVAFVGPYRDIPRLAEIASANRAVQIGGFTEIAPAESWLLGMTGGDPPEVVRRDTKS